MRHQHKDVWGYLIQDEWNKDAGTTFICRDCLEKSSNLRELEVLTNVVSSDNANDFVFNFFICRVCKDCFTKEEAATT